MESKKFSNDQIYIQLSSDYYKHSQIHTWEHFIREKDIGVEVICEGEDWGICEGEGWGNFFEYIVTDEKKWLLSKLKYGI